jgi:hypothetical protein
VVSQSWAFCLAVQKIDELRALVERSETDSRVALAIQVDTGTPVQAIVQPEDEPESPLCAKAN